MSKDRDQYNNDDQWRKSSDEWVKTMDESRRRKNEAQLSHERKIFGDDYQCDHDDYGWCKHCLTTIDGEKLERV